MREAGELRFGDLELLATGRRRDGGVELHPVRGFDVGAGNGRPLEAEVHGGTVGLILDGRGRPLRLPSDRTTGRVQMQQWVEAIAAV